MRAQQTGLLIDQRIIGADHPAFDGAHVMGIIEGEIGHPADAAEFLTAMHRPVGFTDILDQRDPAPLLNLGVEPAYSFEQGTRQQLHERVGIGEQGALADIVGFYKGQTAVSGGV